MERVTLDPPYSLGVTIEDNKGSFEMADVPHPYGCIYSCSEYSVLERETGNDSTPTTLHDGGHVLDQICSSRRTAPLHYEPLDIQYCGEDGCNPIDAASHHLGNTNTTFGIP